MGATPANTTLQSVRKAIACQNVYLMRGHDIRRHHHATLKALRLAEAMLEAGYDLDAAIEAVRSTKKAEAA